MIANVIERIQHNCNNIFLCDTLTLLVLLLTMLVACAFHRAAEHVHSANTREAAAAKAQATADAQAAAAVESQGVANAQATAAVESQAVAKGREAVATKAQATANAREAAATKAQATANARAAAAAKAQATANLERQLKDALPGARQCGSCGVGPVMFYGSSTLVGPHRPNAHLMGCKACGWFAAETSAWPLWNGKLPFSPVGFCAAMPNGFDQELERLRQIESDHAMAIRLGGMA